LPSASRDQGPGRLFVVATPIGNLEDLSSRAVEVLSSVAGIAAEDTRRTRKLLSRYSARTPLLSYHEHNETKAARRIVDRISEGADVALVSDAGTPLVSDPGYRIVSLCVREGIEVVAVPGPAAVTAALSVAGLPPHPFYFAGFLPRKQSARRKALRSLVDLPCTTVYYESPHRVEKCLLDMLDVLGDRPAALARELTKVHEEVVRGSLSELAARAGESPLRGEMVILVAGPGREWGSGGGEPGEPEVADPGIPG
jgi:16S rRNA (cytidine1402-2'-O)-methyltransferase